MSDVSQGEGWWQASDGKWYPPEQAPPGYAAPTAPLPVMSPIEPVPPTQPFGAPLGQPVPPLTAGPPPTMPPAAPPSSGLGRGPIIAMVVAAVAILAAVGFFVT